MNTYNSNFTLWSFVIIALLFISACRESHDVNSQSDQQGVPVSSPKFNTTILDPNDYLPLIRKIAQLDTLELVRALCHPDPNRVRSVETEWFCNVAGSGPNDIEEFKRWYIDAQIKGEVWQKADTAYVPIELNAGERHSFHVLEKFNNQWYLVLVGISD